MVPAMHVVLLLVLNGIVMGSSDCANNEACANNVNDLSLLMHKQVLKRHVQLQMTQGSSTLLAAIGSDEAAFVEVQGELTKRLDEASNRFSGFIEDNEESDDACSARTLEAGRMLDHLRGRTKALTDEIKSHLEVVIVSRDALNTTKLAIEDAHEVYNKSMEACESERQAAADKSLRYAAELKELRQIADPKVRANLSINATEEAKEVAQRGIDKARANQTNQTSFFSESYNDIDSWSLAQCQAFLSWRQKRHSHSHHQKAQPAASVLVKEFNATDNATDDMPLTCEGKLKELKKVFKEAYEKITEAKAVVDEQAVDESCDAMAKSGLTSDLVPLIPERDRNTEKILESTAAVSELNPVVEAMDIDLQQTEDHIQQLKTQCADTSAITEYLKRVRDLIKAVSLCPGLKNFELDVPTTVTTTTTSLHCCECRPGVSYFARVMQPVDVQSPAACQQRCSVDSRCNKFKFYDARSSNKCVLIYDHMPGFQSIRGITSGPKQC